MMNDGDSCKVFEPSVVTLSNHTHVIVWCMCGMDCKLRMNTKNVCVTMRLEDMFRYMSSILNTIGRAYAII